MLLLQIKYPIQFAFNYIYVYIVQTKSNRQTFIFNKFSFICKVEVYSFEIMFRQQYFKLEGMSWICNSMSYIRYYYFCWSICMCACVKWIRSHSNKSKYKSLSWHKRFFTPEGVIYLKRLNRFTYNFIRFQCSKRAANSCNG